MASRRMASMPVQTPPRQTAAPAMPRGSPLPTTPRSQATTPVGSVADSPGNWRHPRLDEITRRRAASMFTEANLKTAVYNGLALAAVAVARTANNGVYQKICALAHVLIPSRYAPTLWLLLQLALLLNIVRAILPLFRQPDPLADIPLTPGQRQLLGLPALRTPVPPGTVFATPPRYARTPSLSGSPASGLSAASHRATGGRSYSGGSYAGSYSGGSPLSGSPLFSKALKTRAVGAVGAVGDSSPRGGGLGNSPFASRRSSFGSPGALANSGGGGGSSGSGGAASLFSDPSLNGLGLGGTPSPSSGKRLSMGLNNKWLYEKGRRTSGSGSRLY